MCRAETQSVHEVYQLKSASVSTADYPVQGQNVLGDNCKYLGLSEVGWWHVWLSLAGPKQNSKTLVPEIMSKIKILNALDAKIAKIYTVIK